MIIGECFSAFVVLVGSFLSGTSTELADLVTGLLVALGVVFVVDGDDELAFTAGGFESELLSLFLLLFFGVVGDSFRAIFGDYIIKNFKFNFKILLNK